jgi:hypothetical protein
MEVMKDITDLIYKGGDERLDILGNGNNKYHINPLHFEKLFNRGSCTCSTLNPLTVEVLESELDFSDKESMVRLRETQAQRLKDLLNYEGKDTFDLVFAPSGSDLAYLPIMFSKILYPEKEILLILTCPEELGSGSQMAYLGRYYASRNQFGDKVEKGDEVNVRYDVNLARFKARNDDGLIIKHGEKIKDVLSVNPDKSKIGALVIGSKSGIEDDISMIPNLNKDVLWVVDLCQFRNSKKLVNHLLSMGCMVMITGSKFYMAPPFCGVMLVPKSLANKIDSTEIKKENLAGFNQLFSQYDFTDGFSNLRKYFPTQVNEGLALRWEIALNEMERFNEIPRGDALKIIEDWNEIIGKCIEKSKHLELMPHQKKTNQSIISFRVKSRFGTYLNYDELKILYKEIVDETYKIGSYEKIFFGQPVKYSCGAFIRVAIGAYNIYNLLQKEETSRFDNDKLLMAILDEKARTFI